MIRSVARLDGPETYLRPLTHMNDFELGYGAERRPLCRVIRQHQDIHEALHGKTEVDTDPDHTRIWNPEHATGPALAHVQLRA
ncbi:hypothetical protein [Micromonospora sp. LH3U1]|uniref:hypothetical protein n=1 Tax=Micromonospora sp. LH3U1 TaxID=3018339 RepID=UPI002349B43C|nr:hypothetical protein [Micromonospora sp. LH3U1]WCN81548.1 hypothetical protein PCA76_00080 [Micromonospora sp. LH3U1]